MYNFHFQDGTKRQDEWLRSSIPPSASSHLYPAKPFFFSFYFYFIFLYNIHQHLFHPLVRPSFLALAHSSGNVHPRKPMEGKERREKVVHNSIMSTQPAEEEEVDERTPFEHPPSLLPTLFYHFSLCSIYIDL